MLFYQSVFGFFLCMIVKVSLCNPLGLGLGLGSSDSGEKPLGLPILPTNNDDPVESEQNPGLVAGLGGVVGGTVDAINTTTDGVVSSDTLDLANSLNILGSSIGGLNSSILELSQLIPKISESSLLITKQLNSLNELSENLKEKISNPLTIVQPILDSQLELVTSVTSSVNGLAKDLTKVVKSILRLIKLLPYIIGSIGSTLGLSIILFIFVIMIWKKTKGNSQANAIGIGNKRV